MGIIDLLFGFLSKKKKKANIVCCGLDSSGKTTIINQLKPKKQQTQDIVPTVGCSVEHFTKHNLNFTVFDMSGQGKYRNMWETVFSEVSGVIFVIDGADRLRMALAQNELEALLNHKELQGSSILFIANKKDLPGFLSASECSELLKLHNIKDNSWAIFETNAISGEGLEIGIKWLANEIEKKMSESDKK